MILYFLTEYHKDGTIKEVRMYHKLEDALRDIQGVHDKGGLIALSRGETILDLS